MGCRLPLATWVLTYAIKDTLICRRSKVTQANSSEKAFCEAFCMKQRNQTVQDAKQGNSKFSWVSWGNFLLARMDGQPFHVRKKESESFSKTSGLLIFIFSFWYFSSLPYFPIHLSDFLKSGSTKCLIARNSVCVLDITEATGDPWEWIIFPWAWMARVYFKLSGGLAWIKFLTTCRFINFFLYDFCRIRPLQLYQTSTY